MEGVDVSGLHKVLFTSSNPFHIILCPSMYSDSPLVPVQSKKKNNNNKQNKMETPTEQGEFLVCS